MNQTPDILDRPSRGEGLQLTVPSGAVQQAELHPACTSRSPLGVVLGSLAVGGAERIVLDWAHRNLSRYDIWLCVLSDMPQEWTVPEGVNVVRLQGLPLATSLRQ